MSTKQWPKLDTLDTKYNFPSTTPTKRGGSGRVDQLESSFDKDLLFSPTNSMSESGTPVEQKKTYNYGLEDSLPAANKKDYLANISHNSADLEDSILGELLGGPSGGSKKVKTGSVSLGSKKKTNTNTRLEPVETSSTFRSDNLGVKPSLFQRNGSPSKSNSADDHSLDMLSSPLSSSRKPVYNSEDDWDASDDNNSPVSSNKGVKNSTDRAKSNSPYTFGSTQSGGVAASDAAGSSSSGAQSGLDASKGSTVDKSKDTDTDVDMGGFVPSFLEPGRQGRRRRYVVVRIYR